MISEFTEFSYGFAVTHELILQNSGNVVAAPEFPYELARRRSVRPMPVLKVGKYLRFRWAEIEQWLNECRRG